MLSPETRFANVGNDRVAYQVLGSGSRDVICTNGQWGHLDLDWDDPSCARFLKRLSSFCRLIRFNMRGTGLSDPRPRDGRAAEEHWAEDLLAVIDGVHSDAVTIFGWIDAGLFALPFAAKHPDRVSSLILMNATARFLWAPDYPEGQPPEVAGQLIEFTRKTWGTEKGTLALMPSLGTDTQTLRALSRIYRAMATPKAVAEGTANYMNMDVRPALAAVRAPTLVMTRSDYRFAPMPHGQYIAKHVNGAHFVALPGADAMPWSESQDLVLDHVEEFVTGARRGNRPERALLAILFTDIVDSTKQAAQLGDAAWRVLLDRHDQIQREQVAFFHGRLVEFTGDGCFAAFCRPDQAIECARVMSGALAEAGIHIRAGIHFGDVEQRDGGTLGGITVHIGARVAASAGRDEIMVSRTVRDVLLGSHFHFLERGVREFKGIPGEWALYSLGEDRGAGAQQQVPADVAASRQRG